MKTWSVRVKAYHVPVRVAVRVVQDRGTMSFSSCQYQLSGVAQLCPPGWPGKLGQAGRLRTLKRRMNCLG